MCDQYNDLRDNYLDLLDVVIDAKETMREEFGIEQDEFIVMFNKLVELLRNKELT